VLQVLSRSGEIKRYIFYRRETCGLLRELTTSNTVVYSAKHTLRVRTEDTLTVLLQDSSSVFEAIFCRMYLVGAW